MNKEPLVRCVYMHYCDVSCAFKKGVKYDHLSNSIANIPGSDTEQELITGRGTLRRALNGGGWWIRCKNRMFGSGYSDMIMTGRIHFDDTEEFEDGLRDVKREYGNV